MKINAFVLGHLEEEEEEENREIGALTNFIMWL